MVTVLKMTVITAEPVNREKESDDADDSPHMRAAAPRFTERACHQDPT